MNHVQMFQSVFVFLFTVPVLLAIPAVVVLTLDVSCIQPICGRLERHA
jgi:hypothetical protein